MQFSFRPRGARQLALAAGALSLASFLSSCDKTGGDFEKTKSGIEYKIFKNVGGKYERRTDIKGEDATYKDRIGKFLTAYLYYRTGKDSVLADTRKKFGSAVPMPLMEIKRKGMPDEAFALLQPGDSAVFRFNADSLSKPQGQPVPGYLKRSGNVLVINVKADKLITREEEVVLEQTLQQKMMEQQQKQLQAYAETQNKKDEVTLQDYLKKNNLTPTGKTPGGVYYIITQPGTGAKPKPGQQVSLNYRGMLLSGKEFDASAKHDGGKPFSYVTGRGQVIPGWDEGVAILSKGAKATLLIPSSLAYGERGAGADIPANSPLRFDVELVDVKEAPAAPSAPTMPSAPAQ